MYAGRFDAIVRSLAAASSRRVIVRGLAGLALVRAGARLPDAADAKQRKKKLQRNAFGCVDVGGKCRGKDANCCSGICQGKKPKKGKKDKSRCVGHDESICTLAQDACVATAENCATTAGPNGTCFVTTGNAPYCASPNGRQCFPCTKDEDCQSFCGAAAACLKCPTCESDTVKTVCAGIDACVFPA
jgi:hypothetical protein